MQYDLNFIAEQLLAQQRKSWNILLIGDVCVDKYVFGFVDRVSPEAPVPVFTPQTETEKPGMAANVRENLRNLDCTVELLTLPGSVKTRFIDTKSGQHILRLDQDAMSKSLELTAAIPPIYNAIVISDYNKGCVSYELIEQVIEQANCPVFIDTKKQDLQRFNKSNVFVKINEIESSLSHSTCDNLIVTLGSKGCLYSGKFFPTKQVPVSDVCGAGDTFLAALVYEYLNTGSIDRGIEFANIAAAVTVKHLGVYAPTLKEIDEIRRIG
jgi:bifunctional ADP-heptose synthase (sugar kinase/adenylyltransferase)